MDFLFRTVWPSYTTASLCSAIPAHRKPTQPHPSQFLFQRHCLCMTSQIELNLPKTFHLNRPAHAAINTRRVRVRLLDPAGTDSSISRHKPTPPGYKYTPASNSPLRIQIPNRANFCRSKFQTVLTSRASYNPIPPSVPLGIQTPAVCPLKPDRI